MSDINNTLSQWLSEVLNKYIQLFHKISSNHELMQIVFDNVPPPTF